ARLLCNLWAASAGAEIETRCETCGGAGVRGDCGCPSPREAQPPLRMKELRRILKSMKRILLSWSSGKDSAWSLHVLRRRGEYEVTGLLTTFNEGADCVAMHAVRRELVEQQAS